MTKTIHQLDELGNKILGALALLDAKGTNETVTQAMAIVYEGFERQANCRPFSTAELLATSKKLTITKSWSTSPR